MTKNNRKTGYIKESQAADYLKNIGYEILERNFYSKFGEIDIIAAYEDELVFVEVKFRSSDRKGYPEEAVSPKKLRAMILASEAFMKEKHISFDIKRRYDLICILGDKHINHLENITF